MMLTIRLVLGMVATKNLHLEQLDVKTPSWWLGGRHLHKSTRKVYCLGTRESSLQTEKKLVWPKASFKTVVQKNLIILWIELGSRDVKLIIVTMLSSLTILISLYNCIWMICLLQGLAYRRLIIWRSNCQNSLQWRVWELQNKFLVWKSLETSKEQSFLTK